MLEEAHSVSIVIPVYNTERYVEEALASVLDQEHVGEVIVVDDGSTDRSLEVVKAMGRGIRVLSREHAGIGATRNAGVAEATCPLIAFIDADDRWLPGKLRMQVDVFRQRPDVDLVYGCVKQFLSPDASTASGFRIPETPHCGFHFGTVLARREAIARVGPLREDLTVGEAVDWYARAVDAGLKMVQLNDVIYERRVHGSNTVISEKGSQSDYLRVLKAAIDRRRAAGR